MSAREEIRQESRSSVKISTTASKQPLPVIKVYEETTAEEMERIRVLAVGTYLATVRDTANASRP